MKKISVWVIMSLLISYHAFGAGVEDYAGTYSGTLSGNDVGEWIAIVESTGEINALFWSTLYNTMDGVYEETISSEGYAIGYTEVNHSKVNIYFDGYGGVSGSWYLDASTSGSLSGIIQTETAQYIGDYSGTISGDNTGTWSLTVNSSGYIYGATISQLGEFPVEGAVNSDGDVLAYGDTVGVYGKIVGTGVSGIWSDSYNIEHNGTLSGGINSVDDNGGGGGGGGCFIRTLLIP